MRISRKNILFQGAEGKESLYDIEIPDNWNEKLIVFIHGYMGYKDWGCWNLVSDFFTKHNYGFLKYNASHNGGTIENPIDFDDLESFSKNTYAFELQDFEAIIDEIKRAFTKELDIYLIGHSRGGGIALLQSDNGHVKKICTWAAIASIADRFPKDKELIAWEEDGFYFRKNGRTNQQMPHHYSQYESFLKYQDRLDIKRYCLNSTTPTAVIHGDNDTSVSIDEGQLIAQWTESDLITIKGAQHTFGASQPWGQNYLPNDLELVCAKTLAFFNEQIEESNVDMQEKLSILSDLIKMAKSDDKVREIEFQFLLSIAGQLGISKSDFQRLFEEYIEFSPPKMELDRIVQFQRLILLMNVDLHIDTNEMDYIRDIGMRMGLRPMATDEVLKRMHNYDNKIIPPEELIQIFKKFNN